MNTSAGAPCSIWVSSALDESVENVMVDPGLAVSQAFFSSPRAFFREAAP
jgi:hypothetical protein